VVAFGSKVTVQHHLANFLPLKKQHTHIYINLEEQLLGENGTLLRMLLCKTTTAGLYSESNILQNYQGNQLPIPYFGKKCIPYFFNMT
jgi:hypothetical protein